MSSISKTLIIFGVVLIVIGVIVQFASKIPWLGRLPGDIHIQRENFSFYFPISTCLVISAILSLIFYLLSKR